MMSWNIVPCTELALARTSLYDLLDTFAGNVSDNANVPHSFANRRVVERIANGLKLDPSARPKWRSASIQKINDVALQLLRADTALRLRATA